MSSLSTSSHSHSRSISLTDPFADPTTLPVPSSEPRSAPPSQTTYSSRPNMSVKEVPTVKPVDPSPRHKMGRSTTAASVTTPTSSSTPANNPQPPKNVRSISHDSASGKSSGDKRQRPKATKKGSVHADVIDRLDFSGIGAGMFHHDGPFDACAPSRNKHRAKAPMLAWSGGKHEGAEPPAAPAAKLEQNFANLGLNDSPYPSQALMPPAPPVRMASDIAGKGRLAEALPKKRTDALAEAWGVHEPEPYEEFLAGGGSGRGSAASSIRAGKEGHSQPGGSTTARRPREGKERETARDNNNDDSRPPVPRRQTTRSQVPPPQPIFASKSQGQPQGELNNQPLGSSPPRSGASTKRSRSLMQRIRKMRETPNVPVTNHDEEEGTNPSPSSSIENYTDKSDEYKEKTLPTVPLDSPDSVGFSSGGEAYFDSTSGAGSGIGVSRRTSLMKKMVKGVKRAGKA